MDNKEMEAKVLQLLQSPDKGMQKLGLELMQANNLKCPDWFDGLDQIYEIKLGEIAESKDQLIEFFNDTSLDFSYKNLPTLPKSIGLLVNLEWLYLHNNQLISIPLEIRTLVNLKELWLHNNPISKDHINHLKTIIPKNCEISH